MTPLPLHLRESQSFATFIAGAHNQWCVDTLQGIAATRFSVTYLAGAAATGKTHLLRALAATYRQPFYSPCRTHGVPTTVPADVDIVLLDDVGSSSADAPAPVWSHSLFDIYAHCEQAQLPLVVTDRLSAAALPILPDVASRLSSGTQLRLATPDDDDIFASINELFFRRGMVISAAATRFLLHHAPRNIGVLRRICLHVEASLGSGGDHRGISIALLKQAIDAKCDE